MLLWLLRNAPSLIAMAKEVISLLSKKGVSAQAEVQAALLKGDPVEFAKTLHQHCVGSVECAPPAAP